MELLPKPKILILTEGLFRGSSESIRIQHDPQVENMANSLAEQIQVSPSQVVSVVHGHTGPTIHLGVSDQEDHGLEGYQLKVSPNKIEITASNPAGVFYGMQTLLQLLPLSAQQASHPNNDLFEIPCLLIQDQPRFPWRGLMLDSSRHFMPVDFIKKFIDVLASQKMNMFHWHLTDDQGWRLESKAYPLLTQISSMRSSSPRKDNKDEDNGIPYGPFFYTREQIKEVVAYAKKQFVTVVPEIDMPGHCKALLAAYPEWGCTGGPYEVRTSWGVEEDALCIGNESVFEMVKNVLEEVMELFPGIYIHIGGDEVPTVRWEACPKCAKRMEEEGLTQARGLQHYFTHRIADYMEKFGRRLIGWDEILEGTLPPSVSIMSWQGEEGGLQAAKAGHDAIMSPHTFTYLDYRQSEAPQEPGVAETCMTLEKTYSFEPIPPTLSTGEAKHILGLQGNIWTEYMHSPEEVEHMAFPRACALAEIAWSPSPKNFADFTRRLERHLLRLEQRGVNFRPLEKRVGV